MKKITFYICSFCISLISFSQPNIELSSVASGFDMPVSIKNAGDSRLFVVEQDGRIKIINSDGSVNATSFLDINTLVFDNFGIGDERGLLGLAFHPNYSSNGYFYVNYINNSGNTVVSRFTVSAGDPNTANASSELNILTITQPFSNHNGGDMNFGPDGYLYISVGDGGSAGDPQGNGQNINTLLGKMLRIDVDNTSNGNNYAIPSDNPFAADGNNATLDEIWAYGLRNAWKFSFDSANGDLWIADVGQNQYEEINKVNTSASGLNYGWRCYEGDHAYDTSGCPPMNTLTFPVAEYSHSNSGNFKCSITGGYRHRGTENTGLNGYYFFADYCSNEIGTLEEDGSNWNMYFSEVFSGNNWVAFGEDNQGELYIAGIVSGTIYKIVDGDLSTNDFEENTAVKMYPNPAKDEVIINFNSSLPETISIFDIQGKLVKQIETIEENLLNISTRGINKGLYIVSFKTQTGEVTRKKLIIK